MYKVVGVGVQDREVAGLGVIFELLAPLVCFALLLAVARNVFRVPVRSYEERR